MSKTDISLNLLGGLRVQSGQVGSADLKLLSAIVLVVLALNKEGVSIDWLLETLWCGLLVPGDKAATRNRRSTNLSTSLTEIRNLFSDQEKKLNPIVRSAKEGTLRLNDWVSLECDFVELLKINDLNPQRALELYIERGVFLDGVETLLESRNFSQHHDCHKDGLGKWITKQRARIGQNGSGPDIIHRLLEMLLSDPDKRSEVYDETELELLQIFSGDVEKADQAVQLLQYVPLLPDMPTRLLEAVLRSEPYALSQDRIDDLLEVLNETDMLSVSDTVDCQIFSVFRYWLRDGSTHASEFEMLVRLTRAWHGLYGSDLPAEDSEIYTLYPKLLERATQLDALPQAHFANDLFTRLLENALQASDYKKIERSVTQLRKLMRLRELGGGADDAVHDELAFFEAYALERSGREHLSDALKLLETGVRGDPGQAWRIRALHLKMRFNVGQVSAEDAVSEAAEIVTGLPLDEPRSRAEYWALAEANTLLGEALYQSGSLPEARDAYAQAAAFWARARLFPREGGARINEVTCLEELQVSERDLGNIALADEYLTQAERAYESLLINPNLSPLQKHRALLNLTTMRLEYKPLNDPLEINNLEEELNQVKLFVDSQELTGELASSAYLNLAYFKLKYRSERQAKQAFTDARTVGQRLGHSCFTAIAEAELDLLDGRLGNWEVVLADLENCYKQLDDFVPKYREQFLTALRAARRQNRREVQVLTSSYGRFKRKYRAYFTSAYRRVTHD